MTRTCRIVLIVCLSIALLAIDTKHYIYAYYRIMNGDTAGNSGFKLASPFYFYEKDESERSYIVYHREFDLPIFFFADRKPNFSDFVSKGLVVAIGDFQGCKVYRSNGSVIKTFVDFNPAHVANAVLSTGDLPAEKLEVICGMLR